MKKKVILLVAFATILVLLSSAPLVKAEPLQILVSGSALFNDQRHAYNIMAISDALHKTSVSKQWIGLGSLFIDAPQSYSPNGVLVDGITLLSQKERSRILPPALHGASLTPESLLESMEKRLPPWAPPSAQIPLSKKDNTLLYITGHGGMHAGRVGFLRFRNRHDLTKEKFKRIISAAANGSNRLLVLVETCQAASLLTTIPPNAVVVFSSGVGESSLSETTDLVSGLPISDQFSRAFIEAIEKTDCKRSSSMTVADLVDWIQVRQAASAHITAHAGSEASVQWEIRDFIC